MDFVRLGPAYSNNYQPDADLIENFNSLIWHERYQAPGEFQITSFDVRGLAALLPEDTLVSHLETQEVMMVETHDIAMVGEGDDARPEITIKGRSAAIILEHRWVEANYGKKRRMRRGYSATSAASVLLVNAVDNASGKDITRGDADPETAAEGNDYPWTTLDVIPNVAVTESVASEGAIRKWVLEEGMLLPQLMKILIDADLGLRVMRPVPGNAANVVTVATALATRGTITRTYNPNIAQALRFDVYSGVDKSSRIQFSTLQGHLDEATYLNSNKEHKTVVEIRSEVGGSDVYRPGESGLTGWRRKTMDFDGGSPQLPTEPEKPDELKKNATQAQREARADAMDKWIIDHAKWKNKRDRIIADFKEENALNALRELKSRRKVSMFSGAISPLSPHQYKTDYNLGDSVMLYGDYGRSAKMVVSEYVRTQDTNGESGFPGLTAP